MHPHVEQCLVFSKYIEVTRCAMRVNPSSDSFFCLLAGGLSRTVTDIVKDDKQHRC